MRRIALLLIAAGLLGCGEDDVEPAAQPTPAERAAEAAPVEAEEPREKRRGTRLRVAGSEFGSMLFDSKQQAVYIFENDPKGRSACYGECAEAWPPVFTRGEPVAGKGVEASLLGTTRRRGGRRQVTYAGKPLYYYSHEGPGEVLCHNVNLNGGLWWVVGPNGRRRP